MSCDNSVCGTCQNSYSSCIVPCLASCKTCDVLGNCATCDDGKFIDGNVCSDCDLSKCISCAGSDITCTSCHPN